MPSRRVQLTAAVLTAAAAAAVGPALAQQSGGDDERPTSQELFRDVILEDDRTTSAVAGLLRARRATVEATPRFGDLTGDGRADAVVRVVTQGSAGAVAVYVLSTDGRDEDAELRVVYRNQQLHRAVTAISGGALLITVPSWRRGDPVCCPAAHTERRYVWRPASRAFRRTSTRTV